MAFFELMRKRRRVSEEALSEGSEAMLKDALSQLITYHQDFNKLLSETTSLCKVQNQPGRDSASDSVCVNLCLTFLCQEALTLGRDVAVHSAESCATTLLKLVKMDECINMNLETLMKIMKQMIQNNTFSVDHFVGVLFKEPVISLEILWQLHKEDICSIDALLSVKWSHKSFVDMLSTQLTSALTQQLDTTGTSVCISDIIGCLVTIGFSENKEVTAVTKTAIAILDRINKELLDQQNDGIGLVFPISVVTTNITIPKVTLKKFSTVCLSSFMSYNPVHKVSRAIKDQAQWTYAKTPVSLQHFFKQILLQFDPDEVIADLQQILDNKEVNWQMVLSFTSTLLVCVPLATQLMQDYISRLLREGLEGTDMEKTIVGFLFARQACYEGPHAFPSYQEWFQHVFGTSAKSPASTRKTFTFLMKFMTDLVPIESAQHLKVHTLHPPHAPPKCRDILLDYIDLAKTRLADLEESVEIVGDTVYDATKSTGSKEKQLDVVDSDVEKAVSLFDNSGKVPSTVMEASIFRKPYFVGRFLPSLLKPRPLPDIPDSKMKLIEALKRSEKIPSALYAKYESSCQQEAAQLMEGVFMEAEDDDAMDDMDLEPLDQLRFRLDQMSQAVIELPSDSTLQSRVSELLALVRDKLSVLLPESSNPSCNAVCMVIPDELKEVPPIHTQVVECLLEFYSKTVGALLKTDKPVFGWGVQMSSILSEFFPLHKALLFHMWKMVAEKSSSLEENNIIGLASVIACMEGQKDRFDSIHVMNSWNPELRQPVTFMTALWTSLPSQHAKGMIFSIRLMGAYLKFMFCVYEEGVCLQLITPELIKQFFWMCTRLVPEVRNMEMSDSCLSTSHPDLSSAVEIFTSDKFQDCLQKYKIAFSDWVALEICIQPEKDVLTVFDRQDYYVWVIYEYYLVQHSYKAEQMCSVLLQTVMEGDMRTYTERSHHTRYHLNRNSIINILQPLLGFLDNNTAGNAPWLLVEFECLVNKHRKTGKNSIQIQWAVTCFFRTALLLPRYLFFCNCLGKVCGTFLTAASKFVNNYVVQYCTEGYHLPLYLTAYLVQGLQQIMPSLLESDWPAVDQFLSSCPVVIVSSIVYLVQMKSTIQIFKSNQNVSGLLKAIFAIILWIERCESGVYSEPGPEPVWMYAVALYYLASHRLNEVKLTGPQLLGRMMKSTGNRTLQILNIYGDLLCCDLAKQDITCDPAQSTNIGNLLWHLLRTVPSTLVHLAENNKDFLKAVASSSCLIHCPLSVLKLLKSKPLSSVLDLENTAPSVVNMFATACQQFEESEGNATKIKPLTVTALTSLCSFVKSCIANCSSQQLRHIDQAKVQLCSPDLVMTMMQRQRQLLAQSPLYD